ncbi:MAG: FIG003437: hypothetical with DnaJ-like domain, partial [uncultured Acetobacteraceae bacterium]
GGLRIRGRVSGAAVALQAERLPVVLPPARPGVQFFLGLLQRHVAAGDRSESAERQRVATSDLAARTPRRGAEAVAGDPAGSARRAARRATGRAPAGSAGAEAGGAARTARGAGRSGPRVAGGTPRDAQPLQGTGQAFPPGPEQRRPRRRGEAEGCQPRLQPAPPAARRAAARSGLGRDGGCGCAL